MAIEAERLIAIFEARLGSLEKSVKRGRDSVRKSLGEVERDASRTEDVLSKIGSRGTPGLDRFGRSAGAARASVQQLQFQLNDIATQLASGSSPFIVMAQQGGQVAQAFSGVNSIMAGVRLVGAAAINPITLATVALTTLSGVMASYFTDTSQGSDEVNRRLEEHAQLIDRLAERWGHVVPAFRTYADELKRTKELAELEQGRMLSISREYEMAGVAVDQFTKFLRENVEGFDAITPEANELNDALSNLRAATDALRAEQERGGNTADEFARVQDAIAKIQQSSLIPETGRARDVTKELAAAFRLAAQNVEELNRQAKDLEYSKLRDPYLRDPRNANRPTIELPATAPAPDRLGVDDFIGGGEFRTDSPKAFLRSRAVSGRIAARIESIDGDFADGLSRVLAQFPELRVVSARRTTAEQADIYNSGVRPAARPGHSLHERGLAVDLGLVGGGEPSGDLLRRLYAAAREAGIEFPVRGDPFHAQPIGARGGGGAMPALAELKDAWTGLRDQDIRPTTDAVVAQTDAYANLGQVGLGALRGLAGALADGKLEGHELLQILVSVIEQLSAIPNLGGGMGGGGGLLGMLFGGGGGSGFVAGAGGGFAGLIGYSNGGPVRGAGTSTSDSIPARLSDGEFVVNARSARKNRGVLEAINSGREPLPDGRRIPVELAMPAAPRAAAGNSLHFAPSYSIDARGSQMTAGQFRAVLRDNNKQVLADARRSLPSWVQDNRLRGGRI